MVAQLEPLGTASDVVSPVVLDPRRTRRRERLAAQRVLSRLSSLAPVRGCGVRWVAGANGVGIRVADSGEGRRAGLANLRTCGSVWACPVCSAKILAHRQDEIQRAAIAWHERPQGGRIVFFTFTVRHTSSQTIDQVWDAVSAAQHAITAGRAHQREKIAYGICSDERVQSCDVESCGALVTCSASVHGSPDLVDERYGCDVASCGEDSARGRRHGAICRGGILTRRALRARAHLAACRIGLPTDRAAAHASLCRLGEPVSAVLPWLRVVEVTTGVNGWHVHQHMAVFLPDDVTGAEVDALYRAWHGRWAAGAAAAGCEGSELVNVWRWVDRDPHGVQGLADYMAKQTYSGPQVLGLEVARPDLKAARFGNRSTFELLHDVVANRDPADVALWHAFERGSRGRRQMTWSHGAREVFAELRALDVVEATDEDVAAVEVGTVQDTVAWLPFDSWRWVLSGPGRKADLLDAFERSSVEGLAWLDSHGVLWERADGRAGGPSTLGDGPPALGAVL